MLSIKIKTQPNDITCGPTSLHSIYRYFGDKIKLKQVIHEVPSFAEGGTLAVSLGAHALARGYRATIFSYNLHVLDPTWANRPTQEIKQKLLNQAEFKTGERFRHITNEYIKFLDLGGELAFKELSVRLLKSYFIKRVPILVGLSATYLYRTKREYTLPNNRTAYDDVRGEPAGHFVVLAGYNEKNRKVVVADPYRKNPVSETNYYYVSINRLLTAILLGIVTYDANLLVIEPKVERK